MNSMVLISGPPGAGKTTVARSLAERWEGPAVHLPADAFFTAILSGYIAPWLAASHTQNETVTQAIAAAASVYASGNYTVFVDGVIGPWFVDHYQQAAVRAGVDLHYVALRPDRATAVARARDREHMPLSVYPAGLYESFSDLGALRSNVLDTTHLTANDVADVLRRDLPGGRFRLDLSPPLTPREA